jgi:LacI family transcriptional regulator
MVQPKATIRDVAALAGVSVTTVSHALNDVPGKRVSATTRERIRDAADELRYRPNRLAQGLRKQRSQTIGFMSDDIATTPYASRIILGAQDAAAEAGSLLLLVSSGGDADLEDRELAALIERQVDGVIYAAMFHHVVSPPARLAQNHAVLLDCRDAAGGFSSVVPDEVGGARTAVEELLRHGHRRIMFVNNHEDYPAAHGRLTGYRQALEVYGVRFDPELVVSTSPNSAGHTYDALAPLLGRPERPTALFCFNDRMAMGAYQAAQAAGLSVPQDISIVGFDDQELIASNLRPGLTTMRLPHYEMGRWAVRTLLDEIESGGDIHLSHALLPCPLISRASVGSPPRQREPAG